MRLVQTTEAVLLIISSRTQTGARNAVGVDVSAYVIGTTPDVERNQRSYDVTSTESP